MAKLFRPVGSDAVLSRHWHHCGAASSTTLARALARLLCSIGTVHVDDQESEVITLNLDTREINTLALALSRLSDAMEAYRQRLIVLPNVSTHEIEATDETLAAAHALLNRVSAPALAGK